ncbi:MAG TPA: hypothetical protein VGB04_11025 [Allosphingosinicella sp.]
MTEDEISYYQRRAEQELALARQADNPQAAFAHLALSNEYLERIRSSRFAPTKPSPRLWQ